MKSPRCATRRRRPASTATVPQGGGWATTPSLFPGLVLGWINADLRVLIRSFQQFASSTRIYKNIIFSQAILQKFPKFHGILQNFEKILEIFRKFAKKTFSFLPTNGAWRRCKILQNFTKKIEEFCKNLVDFEKC